MKLRVILVQEWGKLSIVENTFLCCNDDTIGRILLVLVSHLTFSVSFHFHVLIL